MYFYSLFTIDTRRRTTSRAQAIWWRGVPSCLRSKVWALAIGNNLNLTRGLHLPLPLSMSFSIIETSS